MLGLPGFELHRLDRDSHGGGIAVYTNRSIKSKRRKDLESNGIEMLVLDVRCKKESILLCSIYRPPSNTVSYWGDIEIAIEKLKLSAKDAGKQLLLVGDFNVNVGDPSHAHFHHFQNFCSRFQLANYVHRPTRVSHQGISSTIDLVLSDVANIKSCKPVECCFSDHHAVILKVNVAREKLEPLVKASRNLHQIDYSLMRMDLHQQLNDLTWSSVDDAWTGWIETVTHVLDQHAPIRQYRVKQRNGHRKHPWGNPELDFAVLKKKQAHRAWLRSPQNVELREKFVSERRAAHKLNRRCKIAYFQQLLKKDKDNSWNVINGLAGRRKGPQDVHVQAKDLAAHYADILTDPDRSNDLHSPLGPMPDTALSEFPPATPSEVFRLLQDIKPRKATGSDGIPGQVLQKCAQYITPSLTNLINLSLSSGHVPAVLKNAHVTALFKGGDKEDCRQYRPISLLPIVSKVLERIVQARLVSHLESLSCIPPNQFAYRKDHGTEDALTLLTDKLLSARDQHLHTGIVFVDLSKAFDRVQHQTLVSDLFGAQIHGTALSWFCSYLSGRTQKVVIPGQEPTQACPCQRGVPQGSVLGPILFSLYTSPVPSLLSDEGTTCQLYADDIIFSCSSTNTTIITKCLQNSLMSLSTWLQGRGLLLNRDKTKLLAVSGNQRVSIDINIALNGVNISQVQSTKYLGFELDDNLSWNHQVNNLCSKVHKKLHAFHSIRPFLSRSAASLFYQAILLADLLYASNAYFHGLSCSLKDKIMKLNKACLRCIGYNAAQLDKLSFIAENKLKCLMHRCLHNRCSRLLSSRVTAVSGRCNATRGAERLSVIQPSASTGSGSRRSFFQAAIVWNKISPVARSNDDFASFKQHLSLR